MDNELVLRSRGDASVQVVEPTDLGVSESHATQVNRDGNVMPVSEPEPSRAVGEDVPKKVLIVEDATELAEVIAATLERINIVPLHETHVDRALDVYYAERPDLILLDIGLPDKTGWKLLDAIKERDETDRPVVVVITAHGDPANRLMGKLQGVHSYLIKPFTPNEVERIVGLALTNRLRGVETVDDLEDKLLPDFPREVVDDDRWDSHEAVEPPGEGKAPI